MISKSYLILFVCFVAFEGSLAYVKREAPAKSANEVLNEAIKVTKDFFDNVSKTVNEQAPTVKKSFEEFQKSGEAALNKIKNENPELVKSAETLSKTIQSQFKAGIENLNSTITNIQNDPKTKELVNNLETSFEEYRKKLQETVKNAVDNLNKA